MARSPLGPQARHASGGAWRLLARCLRGTSRITVVVVLLALMAGGMALSRLAQGPVSLPVLAEALERRVNLRLETGRVTIGDAVVGLGRVGAPSGLVFEDVRVTAPDGTLLMAAPRLSARFDLADLLVGRVRPKAITLTLPRMAILRAADGRIRVGLGGGAGVAVAGAGGARGPEPDAVAAVIDAMVGDAPGPPVLSELESIRVRDAEVTYRDAVTGLLWRTAGSDIALWRTAEGARGTMRAALSTDGVSRASVTVAAERARGAGETRVALSMEGLEAAALAAHLPDVALPEGAAAALTGRARARLGPDGGVRAFSGRLAAESVRLPGLEGALARLDRLSARFTWDPEIRRLALPVLEAEGPGLSARLSGHLAPAGPDPGAPEAVAVDLRVGSLSIDEPALFPEPIAFDGGRLAGRVRLDGGRAEIAAARLTAGGMVLSAAGTAGPGPRGRQADLRLAARNVSVARLKTHWPVGAAPGARAWVRENLLSGTVPGLSGRARLGPNPALELAFDFRDVTSRYLGAMPPIEGGRGDAELDLSRFTMRLAEGRVTPGEGAEAIRLGGSRLTITELLGPAPPGDVTLTGRGRTADILALIDHAPLGLVGKLGLDLGRVAGRTRVTATLGFPMLADLAVEDVAVEAEATLSDTRLSLPLAGAARSVAAERLSLTATTESMTLSGRARLAGRGLDLRWLEEYGPGPGGRSVTARGSVDAAFLEDLGLPAAWLRSGNAGVLLEIEDRGGPAQLALSADLGPAALAFDPLRWGKAAGRPGRLTAEGRLTPDGLAVDSLSLEAAGLEAEGRVALDPQGRLREGRLARFRLGARADLAARFARRGDGGLAITVSGALLDLSGFVDDPPATGPPSGRPVTISAEIDRLRLTPAILVEGARGRLAREADGRLTLDLSGEAGAPFTALYRRAPGVPGEVRIESPDAGRLLGGLGFLGGATGGALSARATLAPGPSGGVSGSARIEGMTVRGADTFGTILDEGGVEEAAEAVRGGGLTFDSVVIRFSRTDGVLGIDRAIARAPLLAITAEGTVDEAAGTLDLRGVISPAYAITGAFDEIPLLGALLTGGRGEGILAMTFTVTGPLADPRFAVNPLSLLAPGILRRVFSGGGGEPSQRFLDQLGRGE